MSWDLAAHSSGPLGTATEVRKKVDAVSRGVDWEDETAGVVQQGEYLIEFYLTGLDADEEADEPDPSAPVRSLLISVRGSGELTTD